MPLWQFVHAVSMLEKVPSRTTADFISIADGAGAGKSCLLSELPSSLLQAIKATSSHNNSASHTLAAEVSWRCSKGAQVSMPGNLILADKLCQGLVKSFAISISHLYEHDYQKCCVIPTLTYDLGGNSLWLPCDGDLSHILLPRHDMAHCRCSTIIGHYFLS